MEVPRVKCMFPVVIDKNYVKEPAAIIFNIIIVAISLTKFKPAGKYFILLQNI